jgi:hypothetical protein
VQDIQLNWQIQCNQLQNIKAKRCSVQMKIQTPMRLRETTADNAVKQP